MKRIDKTIFEDITLLYVEDDKMTLEEVSFFLKRYIKNLIIAKNGKEGLELYKKHSPDMVITDIQMPVMNGLEMSEKILELNPETPIAVTTAYSDSDYIVKAIELGIDKYILKPINMKEILAVIQKSILIKQNITTSSMDYKNYVQFILDSNPTFMFIMHSNKIEYANKKFLELLGHESVSNMKKQAKSIESLFELEDIETKGNWLDYVLQNKEEAHLVSLRDCNLKYSLKRKFNVTYKEFDYMNKSVFIFVETDKDKLIKINTIAEDLLKQSSLKSDVINNLSKIVEMTKRV